MAFNVRIQNIGKLTDANIRIAPLTVLAGPNNTGKSTVSKLLYSVFDGMNANNALAYFDQLVEPLRREEDRIGSFLHYHLLETTPTPSRRKKIYRDRRRNPFSRAIGIETHTEQMRDTIGSISTSDMVTNKNILPGLAGETTKIRKALVSLKNKVIPQFKNGIADQDIPDSASEFNSYIERAEAILDQLDNEFSNADTVDFIKNGLGYTVHQNLVGNFQVENFALLVANEKIPSSVDIDGVGKFTFSSGDEDEIGFDIEEGGIQKLQDYSRVIYMESPLYWKLKKTLDTIRRFPHRRFYSTPGREILNGVPDYFYDFLDALKEDYTGDIAFPEIYEKLISKRVMNGKIVLSELGELGFQENGRNFSLHLAAMGVVNLGMLALLIERKVIDKGSFVFIDEPEAHLHPEWQVVMAETLFELAKEGVNIVIATHSMDILKWLEVQVKKNPEDKKLVALNQFSVEPKQNGGDFDDKMSAILQELTDPFSRTFIRGI